MHARMRFMATDGIFSSVIGKFVMSSSRWDRARIAQMSHPADTDNDGFVNTLNRFKKDCRPQATEATGSETPSSANFPLSSWPP
jgi:hypothetical protein